MMSEEHISHKDIADFADNYVNLPREKASRYREQVNTLRKRLESRLKKDSKYKLRKMLLSGSLAKGTALRSLNDIDVALYVLWENPPSDMLKFINWLVEALRTLYSNMDPSQIQPQQHSVRISFRGSGLDVDIVPIAYDGNSEWDGYLYPIGEVGWLMTNIPKHLEFIRKRKKAYPQHFAQVVRLLKYWVKEIKKRNEGFRCKSLLVELICAHLVSQSKIKLENYVEALADCFNFIVRGGLNDIIFLEDYYQRSEVRDDGKPIRVFDPVNPGNNVAKTYTQEDKAALEESASDAADAVDAALYAATKGETVRHWQKIFGPSFGG